jgi:hypothetical protein
MEPERPIEKTLRACAKTRGEEAGPPLELHPATRRLLQAEVARKYGSRPPEAGRVLSVFAWLRPRLAWCVGLAMIAAVSAWLFLPLRTKEQKKVLLASNETAPAAASGTTAPAESSIPATPPPVAEAPGALSYSDGRDNEQKNALLANDESTLAPLRGAKKKAEQPKTLIEEELHSSAVPLSSSLAPPPYSTQSFARTGPALEPDGSADKAATTASVLNSFKVEQSGAELRIIDGDGSIYVGSVQLADPGNPAQTPAPQASSAFRQSEAKASQKPGSVATRKLAAGPVMKNYPFRVAGTNVSLHQKVVFAGNLVAWTNSASPYSRAQISGRAVIDGREIRIDASSRNVTNGK